ncbi:Sec-independent protein translocase protein TatB [Neorhizobium alkalisoli]|uniref:Sec-independent protein translocase protein TatB n=1 Tax=Neorhizobium alkalisoli TaxID=528178 RepID=A0A561R1F0_9HYPH|nr:Sec-independent protein translocase protein TatB [Neorhizobium alkalisoli]TWF56422.1 sec-independent protein translocase protein TatB [Neorhizobium alkalisoli]
MFDIGWSEILVIAVVLIVVVGPKDLPPMLRAFGKMTSNFRKMAGDFRAQFDEALRESEFDDVRKTISDAKSLNPTNALRDAINPLRQMGQDIRNDLQKATQVPSTEEAKTDVDAQQAVEGSSAVAATPEVPPSVEPLAASPVAPVQSAPMAAPVAPLVATPAATPAPATAAVTEKKPRAPRKSAAEKAAAAPVAEVAAAAPAKPKRVSAKTIKIVEAVEPAEKPKRSRAAKPAAPVETPLVEKLEQAVAKAPRKRATKKTETPKDDA